MLEVLREGILSGALPEGEALLQNDIAEILSLSRMPVREALRLLEAEGLVEFSPHKGAIVAMLSIDDVRQIFEIRFALEALALRKSIPALMPALLDQAGALLGQMDVAEDNGQWVALHRQFHLTLYSGCGDRLMSLIGAQYDAVDRYLRLELSELHNEEESQKEHRAILAACRARDVEQAIALLGPHIYEAGLDLADAIMKYRERRAA